MTTVASTAFVGKIYLAVGNGASPEVFERYCEIDSMSGIGGKNALVDVTTFCSDGYMQYIPGLSDGTEVTFSGNYSMNDPIQEGLMDDVDNKVTRNVQIQIDGSSPNKTFDMALAMLSWELDPSVSKQNVIKFVGKITGPIIRA
jgi:hypothetical protein